MDCRQTQDELIGRPRPGADAQQHLTGCEECRRFAADLQLIGTLRTSSIATPALLKEQTLDRCLELLADKTAASRMSLWRRCRRICDSPQFVVTIAALGAIILGWWLANQIPDIAEGSDAIMSIKLAFVQLGVQNFVAALLFPILWMMRFNWCQRRDNQPS
jgi:hypothetical protein